MRILVVTTKVDDIIVSQKPKATVLFGQDAAINERVAILFIEGIQQTFRGVVQQDMPPAASIQLYRNETHFRHCCHNDHFYIMLSAEYIVVDHSES